MKSFNKIFLFVLIVIVLVFVGSNIILISQDNSDIGRPYRVEINRIALQIEEKGIESISLNDYSYITAVIKENDNFYDTDSDYIIKEIKGELYRFDYKADKNADKSLNIISINICLGLMTIVIIAVMLYLRTKVLKPFEKLTDVPYELSKGNLTMPIKESKSKFFGRFIWGTNLLRENLEEQKKRELDLQKERKMLLLSLSHDIKTPLSAIKLYSKALSKGLYTDAEKQTEIAENINSKADEIEGYVSQIITASREDFLSLDVNVSEFYLSEIIDKTEIYYKEKLELIKTPFSIKKYSNCLIKGDADRSIEILQNIIENAIKYGDGKGIEISFSEEEGCVLVTVKNSGCTLSENDLPHIFDSFWRGENASDKNGSGLGLYICRQLMLKMNGDIFAEIKNGYMQVTAVFMKM